MPLERKGESPNYLPIPGYIEKLIRFSMLFLIRFLSLNGFSSGRGSSLNGFDGPDHLGLESAG